MIQQEYPIGQDFNLSTQAQLSTIDSVWKWDHRTLSGFITEDGTFIEPGGIVNFDTQTADVSGVWTLNKDQNIHTTMLGNNGSITIKFMIENTEAPLANSQHKYSSEIDISQTSAFQAYIGSKISAYITPNDGTIIKSISASQHHGTGYTPCVKITSMPVLWNGGFGMYDSQPFGISVDYTNQGILEYVPNKDVYIPTPDNPVN